MRAGIPFEITHHVRDTCLCLHVQPPTSNERLKSWNRTQARPRWAAKELCRQIAGTNCRNRSRNPFHAGRRYFAASWFTHLLRPVRLLALLYGSDQISPAIEGFYFQAFDRSVTLPVAGYDYNSDWTPCMGLFLSRSFSRAVHLSSFVSFFVRSESPFLRLRPEAVARRSCQGWSPLRRPPAGLGSRLVAEEATSRRA